MASERITVVPPGTSPQQVPRRPTRRFRRVGRMASSRALPWALAAVFLVTALAGWWLVRDARLKDTRSAAVQSTTTNFLTALSTFSAQTIEGDVQRIRSYAVGDFATQVQQTFSSARIAQIKSAKVASQGAVQSVFTESISGSQATVFGVVDENISNASNQTPRADVLRVEVGLIETTDGWKVNSVNILQSPGAAPVPSG